MRDALAGAGVAVLRHTRQPGNLGLGSEQAPVGARWGRVRGGFPRAGRLTFSAAGHAHQARTHGLARPPGGSASDRRRSRTGHGRGASRCRCPEASPGPSRGRPRSRSFARQGCCTEQGSLSANRIGGARKYRDRPKQKSAWLRRERCFDRRAVVTVGRRDALDGRQFRLLLSIIAILSPVRARLSLSRRWVLAGRVEAANCVCNRPQVPEPRLPGEAGAGPARPASASSCTTT